MHVSLLRRCSVVMGWVCLLLVGLGWGEPAVAAGPGPGADLVGKQLYLRGLWEQDELSFDAFGQPLGKATAGPVTLSGVDVMEAKVHGKTLVLTGYRVALVAKSDPKAGLERRTIKSARGGKPSGEPLDKMKITIQQDAGGGFDGGLKAVFAEGLEELAGSVPGPWHCYAQSYFVSVVAENALKAVQQCTMVSARAAGTKPLQRAGGVVQPPKVLYQINPQFTPVARELKVSGASLVSITVTEDGTTSDVRIVRAAGAGLDEAAMEAVAHYKFQPATQNGVAVATVLNIEVNFQIF
jgi:TonB family protein